MSSTSAAANSSRRRRSPVVAWFTDGGLGAALFLLPMTLIFALFSWYPIVRAVIMSFQKTNLVKDAVWVGFANYERVLNDPLLPTAVGNTLYLTLLSVLFGFPLPILLATLMSEVRRLRGLYVVLSYLPAIVPPIVSILLWKFFFDASEQGVFNTIFGWVGLGPFPWLQSESWAMPSIVLEGVWAGAGGTVIIYLASLMAVPSELYDAAEVDGAGLFRRFWHITLPSIRPLMALLLILQLIYNLQAFLEPFVFTGGGPANATLTVMLQVYNYAFGGSLGSGYGSATALSVLMALTMAVMSVLYFRVTKRWNQ